MEGRTEAEAEGSAVDGSRARTLTARPTVNSTTRIRAARLRTGIAEGAVDAAGTPREEAFEGAAEASSGVRTEADAVVDNPGAEDVEGEGEEAQVMGANALMGRGTPLRSPSSTTFHLPAT